MWDRTEHIDRLSSVQRETALPTIDDVIAFWFADRTCWFKKDPAFDAEIRGRFQRLHEAISRGDRDDWLETRRGTLAYVIVLDQFSRNMFRGTGRMFASDRQALAAARRAIERGDDQALSADERSFLHMPFMHSEQLSDQERRVALFAAGYQRASGTPSATARSFVALVASRIATSCSGGLRLSHTGFSASGSGSLMAICMSGDPPRARVSLSDCSRAFRWRSPRGFSQTSTSKRSGARPPAHVATSRCHGALA